MNKFYRYLLTDKTFKWDRNELGIGEFGSTGAAGILCRITGKTDSTSKHDIKNAS